MRVAARENAISFKKMQEVQNDLGFILASLERESKRDESVRLAGYLQNALASSVCSRYPQVYNLGVKQALFYVLVDARMPSALVEVSFISNREEERLLSEAAYRQRLAEAIAKGIREYFGAEAPLKVASGKGVAGSQKSYRLNSVSYVKRQKS
jgi:N-acetylmuramoyl-L-alanine amidase